MPTAPRRLLSLVSSHRKVVLHWIVAAPLIAGGIFLSKHWDDTNYDLAVRYRIFQLLQSMVPREVRPNRVAIVQIGDREFWRGELAHRTPIKRDYLAKLILALDSAGPAVIAIDHNFRSPDPSGRMVEDPAYLKETEALLRAVDAVSARRSVVLPSSFDYRDFLNGRYRLDSAIYSQHAFNDNVSTGYTNLLLDLRRVPITWRIQGLQDPARSFSLAMALAVDPELPFPRRQEVQDRYVILGRFEGLKDFRPISVDATDVLAQKDGAWRRVVKNRIAIIGATCRKDGFALGDYVDSQATPAGIIPGVLVHANYVEAWLNYRVIGLIPRWTSDALELLIALIISWSFIGSRERLRSLAITLLGTVFVSYVLLVNLNIFFDWYLPVLIAVLHGFVEQVIEWRRNARRFQAINPGTAADR
jgi:CHASE2 domain-containing sensor protein